MEWIKECRERAEKLLLSTSLRKQLGYMGQLPCASLSQRSSRVKNSRRIADLGIVEDFERGCVWFRKLNERAQRFALGRYGRALPRTPANFRLSQPRFAGLCTAPEG